MEVYLNAYEHELQCRQQETFLTREGLHSFQAFNPRCLPSQRYHHHNDPTSISEGDLVRFDEANCRNLRRSSLLAIKLSEIELQNKDKGLPKPSSPIKSISSMSIALSEGDLLLYEQSVLYGYSTELSAMMHVKIHQVMLLLEVQKQRSGRENCSSYLQIKQDPLSLLTISVSEGDSIDAAPISNSCQWNCGKPFIVKHEFDKHVHQSSSSSRSCFVTERNNNDFQLEEYENIIQPTDKLNCMKAHQMLQFESIIINESIWKHIESTVMVDTTICLSKQHNNEATQQQSTVLSMARLICNVDDGYLALQIKHETNLATSTSHLQHETSAAEQQSRSANIKDMAINLLGTPYDSITSIPLMASIESMPSKSIDDCDGSCEKLMASLLFRALFDGDPDCMVHVMSLMQSLQLQPRSDSYQATSFVQSFMLTSANEGATIRSSVFEAATSFVTSSDVYIVNERKSAKWWLRLILLFNLLSLTLHFTRESENISGRSLINDSNTNLFSFMKFQSSLSSFDIIGIFRLSS